MVFKKKPEITGLSSFSKIYSFLCFAILKIVSKQNIYNLLELAPQFQLSTNLWLIAILGGILVGLSKAGIKGISIIIVTMLVFVFGGKASTGIVLPMLMTGDIMAVYYYNRHAQWKYLRQLLPWMMIGVIVGAFVGKDLPEDIFKRGMAFIILGSVIMMYWWDRRESKAVPDQWWFAGSMGFMAGFTTMIGNLAGAFSNIFFLATRLPKNEFIGTAAWLFFIINIFKLPFHIFMWGTVTSESLMVNLRLVPAIVTGFMAGIYLVKLITDQQYRKFILLVTAIGAILIFFR